MSDNSQLKKSNGSNLTAHNGADDFLIVGIGASAVGIAALKEFFERVPSDSGMAYVVIPHLSPEHESILAEILQNNAKIPVTQVQDEKVRVERKRMEEDLRKSEERFRAIFNQVAVGVVQSDLAGNFVLVNEQYCEMTGYSQAELLEKNWGELTHPEDLPRNVAQFSEMINRGESFQVEKRYIHKNGSIIWVANSVSMLRDEAGKVISVVAVSRDITARKRQEEELRKLSRQIEHQAQVFETTLSNITDLVYIFDRDGHFLYANQPLLDLWGRKAEDAIGKTMAELDYSKEIETKLLKEIREVFDTKQLLKGETPYTSPSGISGFYEYIFSPFFAADGSVESIVGSTRDVSERKLSEEKLRMSEERLRLLIESATDYAIITATTDGLIDSWNKGAERMFGWTEAEIIGKSNKVLFTPEDRAAGVPERETEETLEKGFAEDERWHIRKDESRFYVSGVMWQLLDRAGNLIGFVKIARDMTEKIKLDGELRRSREELEIRVQERTGELKEVNKSLKAEIVERKQSEAERVRLLQQLVTSQEVERRRIARDMHDQLGQQLTALRLKLETLKKDCDKDKLREQIEQVQAIAERLDSEVDFLAWELRPAVLDDLGLKAALANFVKEWSEHFNISAEFHSNGIGKERFAPEAETNLYRIGQEALNNVWKHAQATQVSILLERREGYVMLIIEDNGIGFDLKKKKISDAADRGMGLISMHERAALNGGSLEIESAPGKGTTVYARVPISKSFGKKEKQKRE